MKEVTDRDSQHYLQNNHCGTLCFSGRNVTARNAGRQDHHITYLFAGELEAEYKGVRHRLHSGDFIYYPPHVPQWYCDTPGTERAWIHFTGHALPEILAESRLNGGVYYADLRPDIKDLFYRLVRESHSRHPVSSENGLLLEIVLELGKLARGQAAPSDRLEPAVSYLARRYREPIRVQHLAELCHLSVSRFMYLFKEAQGVTPMEYLLRLRLSTAKSLLTATDLSVSEVAAACGYEDPLYFSRIFKQSTGLSPSAYRIIR